MSLSLFQTFVSSYKRVLQEEIYFFRDARMGMSIESLVHANPTSPVMGNANAGEG